MKLSVIKKLLVVLTFCLVAFRGQGTHFDQMDPNGFNLRVRKPEWIPKIVSAFEDGTPEVVMFYEEDDLGVERAVKRMHFYQGGALFQETDLTEVDENSEGYKAWGSTIVPHGVSVRLGKGANIETWSDFHEGLLDGWTKVFDPNGTLRDERFFNRGKAEGKRCVYDEKGQLSEECDYANGALHGPYISYYPNREKKRLVPYVHGKIE